MCCHRVVRLPFEGGRGAVEQLEVAGGSEAEPEADVLLLLA